MHLLTIAFETEIASDLAHRRFLDPLEPGLFVKAAFDALMIFPLSCFSNFFLSENIIIDFFEKSQKLVLGRNRPFSDKNAFLSPNSKITKKLHLRAFSIKIARFRSNWPISDTKLKDNRKWHFGIVIF